MRVRVTTGVGMCVQQNLCLYLCVRARVCVCVLTVTPDTGGRGSVPSVAVTCLIVALRGGGSHNTHATLDMFYGRSLMY